MKWRRSRIFPGSYSTLLCPELSSPRPEHDQSCSGVVWSEVRVAAGSSKGWEKCGIGAIS